MARNVGSIEVTVDADTGKLKAQITAAGKEAGAAGARALSSELGDIDTTEALNEVRKLKLQIEQQLRAIKKAKLGIDTTALKAELERVKTMIQGLDDTLNLGAEVDLTQVKVQLAEFYNRQEMDELEVTLDPIFREINRLIGAWRKSEEADDLGINVTAEVLEAKRELDALRAEEGTDGVALRIEAKIAEANAEIERWRELHENNPLDMTVMVSWQRAEAQLLAWKTAQGELKLRLAVETATAEAELEALRVKQEAKDIEWWVDMRVGLAEAELIALRNKEEADHLELVADMELRTAGARLDAHEFKAWLEGSEVDVNVSTELDMINIAADLATLRAIFTDIHPDVEPDFDASNAAVRAVEASVASWATEVGKDAGTSMGGGAGGQFGRGFASSFSDGSEIALRAILLFGGDIYTAVEGALGGITALVSSGAYAIAGAGVVAAGAVAIIGAAGAAALVGMQGFGTALGTINDEFAEAEREGYGEGLAGDLAVLSPNAAATALAFRDVKDELAESREEIQNALFAGLDTTIRSLADTTLPDVTEALVIAAEKVNVFATNIGEIAKDTDFTGLMEALGPAMDAFFRAGEDVVGTVEPFLLAAAPAVTTIATQLALATGEFNAWANTDQGREDMQGFFEDSATSLLEWTGLLFAIGGLLATIFEAGKGPGDSFVAKLDEIISKWDGWLESAEGQTALKDFFADSEETLAALGPVFDGLKELVQVLADEGDASGFSELMDSLALALPTIGEALALMSDLHIGELFLDMLGGLRPVFDLLNSMPDTLLEVVGAMYATWKVFGMLQSVFRTTNAIAKIFGTTLGTLTKANPYLLALAGVITAAAFASDFFGGSEDEAAKHTEALSRSLGDQVAELVNTQGAVDGSTAALEAYSTTIEQSGEAGTAILDNLEALGVTGTDAIEVIAGVGHGLHYTTDQAGNLVPAVGSATEAFKTMAAGAGIPVEALEGVAAQLTNLTQGDYDLSDVKDRLWENFGQISEAAGVSEEEFKSMIGTIMEVADAADQFDTTEMAAQQLRLAHAAGGVKRALLEEAIAATGVQSPLDLILAGNRASLPVMEAYTQLMYDTAGGTDQAALAALGLVSGQQMINDQIQLSIEASREKAAAFEAEQKAVLDTYQAEQRAALRLKEAVQDVTFRDFDVPEGLAKGFQELGDNAREAAEAASDLGAALDLLFRPFMTHQEALDNAVQGIADLQAQALGYTVAADGTHEPIEGWTDDLIGQTEAARDNREVMFAAAEGMLSYAETATETGEPIDNIIEHLGNMRTMLEDTADTLDTGTMSAEEYVNTLIGTPEELETVVRTPGLIEALANYDTLTMGMNDLGQPVILELEDEDIHLTQEQTQVLLGMLEGLGIEVVPQVATEGIAPAVAAAALIEDGMVDLADAYAAPTVATTGIDPAVAAAALMEQGMVDLGTAYAAPTVAPDNIEPAATATQAVVDSFSELDLFSVSPTVSTAEIDPAVTAAGAVGTALGDVDGTTAEPNVALVGHIVMLIVLASIKTLLTNINDTVASPTVELPDYPTIKSHLDTLQVEMDTLDRLDADPEVTIAGYATAHANLGTLAKGVANLDFMSASPSVRLDGYEHTMAQIDAIQLNLAQTQDRTVTLTTRNVSAQAMAGALVSGPQLMNVGERGYAEAIIPMQLPLNRVSPEVREMTALLRGQSPLPSLGPARKQSGANINQYFTLSSADPAAVATQALNRAAAMAT